MVQQVQLEIILQSKKIGPRSDLLNLILLQPMNGSFNRSTRIDNIYFPVYWQAKVRFAENGVLSNSFIAL